MLDNTVIIGYIILVLIIGYLSGRKQTGEDFMIASRNLGLWEFVSSVVATLVGGTVLVVYTAYIFEYGVGAIYGFIGLAVGFAFFGYYGRKLRTMAHEHEFHTLADFFHFHFDKTLRHLAAIIIAVIFMLAILKQFIAGTQILVAVSDYSYETSLLISSAVILLYLLMGGFRSVVKTDIFQYLVVMVLILFVGYVMAGEASLEFEDFARTQADLGLIASFIFLGLLVPWFSADIWQRIYAARNDEIVKKGFVISGFTLGLVGVGVSLIGLSARAAFPDIDPSQALVVGVTNLLPAGILTFGVVLLFAAIMSSADTMIFLVATNITKDVIAQIKGRKLTNDELRKYTRISLISIVVFSTVLAYYVRDLIDIALINISFGMAMTPTIIASFKMKVKRHAAKWSILVGLGYSFFWIMMAEITPERMVSTVVASTLTLVFLQKLPSKSKAVV